MQEADLTIQKKYRIIMLVPVVIYVIMGFMYITGYRHITGSEFGLEPNQIKKVFKIICMCVFCCVPAVCVFLSVRTIIKFRRLSDNELIQANEYLEFGTLVKQSYRRIHRNNLFIALISISMQYVSVSILLLIIGLTMAFQTGFIGNIGNKKLYKSGDITLRTYIKSSILEYVLFWGNKKAEPMKTIRGKFTLKFLAIVLIHFILEVDVIALSIYETEQPGTYYSAWAIFLKEPIIYIGIKLTILYLLVYLILKTEPISKIEHIILLVISIILTIYVSFYNFHEYYKVIVQEGFSFFLYSKYWMGNLF